MSRISLRTLSLNSAANLLGFALQVVVTLLASPRIIRGLGDQRYGAWALVESILAYLTLFDLGVGAALVRYVAKFEAERDARSLNQVFSTCLTIFAVAGAVALSITLMMALGWRHPMGVSDGLADEVRTLLLVLGLNLAFGLPLGVFPAILDGLGRYPIKTAIRSAGLLIRTALILGVLSRGFGLVAVALVTTACNLFDHLLLAIAARRYLPGLRYDWTLVDRSSILMVRGYSLYAFLAMIAGRISFQTDAIVIGAFLTPRAITFFVIAARLVEYAKGFFRSITFTLTPAISALESQGNRAAIRKIVLDGTRMVLWLVMPVEVGLLVLGKPFLTLWLGETYRDASYPSLAILSLPIVLTVAMSLSCRVLYGIGRLQFFTAVVTTEAVANLILSVALVRPLGIEGVALGTALPNVVANLTVTLFVLRLLNIPRWDYVIVAWLKPTLMAVLLAGFWTQLQVWMSPTSWMGFLLVGMLGLIAYAIPAVVFEFGHRIMRPNRLARVGPESDEPQGHELAIKRNP